MKLLCIAYQPKREIETKKYHPLPPYIQHVYNVSQVRGVCSPEYDKVHSVLVSVVVFLQSSLHHTCQVIQTGHLLIQLGLLQSHTSGREER